MSRDDEQLHAQIRDAVSELRKVGRIPTEVRLGQAAWNQLRRRMAYGAFGDSSRVQLDGLPCVLVFGMPSEPGFRVGFIEARD